MPTPRRRRMDDHSELLPWPESASPGPRRRNSGWFLPFSRHCESKDADRKDSFQLCWKGERQPARPRGVHQIDTVDLLAIKLELLMKKLESPHQEVNQVLESRMTCETCGETGHSGTSCPLTQEDANFVGSSNNPNSGFHPQ